MKKNLVHFLLVFSLFSLSFFLGNKYQQQLQNQQITNLTSRYEKEKMNFKKQIDQLNQEINALKNDLGIRLDSKQEKYVRDKIGIFSPLLENKQVVITRYRYKDAIITSKQIEIDDYSGIAIWEYDGDTSQEELDKNFVIFGGYENYQNHATPVSEIKKNWQESYKTKTGMTMFYGYDYVPKYIGSVRLTSYHNYLYYRNPKPSLVTIYYSKIDGFPTKQEDPSVLQAKKELNKLGDTISLLN